MDLAFDRLFVVTYGRSGSTLLQGFLNAIPGYRIYGENGGFLTRLHEAHEALVDANRHLVDPEKDIPRHAWFGSSRYDPQTLAAGFRAFADRMLFDPAAAPEVRVFGFKEVRYSDMGAEKLSEFLAFVREIYPRAAIVFNSRNLDDVVTSGWWRNVPRAALRIQLARFDAFAGEYARVNPDHAIHVRYDAIVDPDRREVARLLSFLGETLAADRTDGVFAVKHSYGNRALSEYLSGRAAHVELLEHDWWKGNVDEFRIDIERRPQFCLAKGVFLPADEGGARITLKAGPEIAELVGSSPTARLAKLFPENPRAATSGFRLELTAADEVRLFGASRGFATTLVGIVKAVLPSARPGARPAASGPAAP
ncbi:MAG: sulfotransferase [Caulobacteraceae bacterium]